MMGLLSFVLKKLKYLLLAFVPSLCFLLLYTILVSSSAKQDISIPDKYATIPSIARKLNIGIIIVSDADAHQKYDQHGKNLECYALRHGYTFVILDPKYYFICSHLENFYFQKHCTVMNYLMSMSNLNWLLVLDGDHFVVNSSKLIEEFIPKDENIHVVHYERFLTGEIMAGAYLIQNHLWSHKYLLTWVNFYSKLPKRGYHNHDNGALHMVFLQMIGKGNAIQAKCYSTYLQSSDEWTYYKYIRCYRCSIGGQRIFEHIRLLRRGHGFSRDFSIPFTSDFMLHGYKNDLNIYFYNSTKCSNDWLSNIRKDLFVSNITIAKDMIIKEDQDAIKKYSTCLGIADIRDCWPNCEQEITGKKLVRYLRTLCRR